MMNAACISLLMSIPWKCLLLALLVPLCRARYLPYAARELLLNCRVEEDTPVEVLIIKDGNFVMDGTGR
jgi:hypothetical protein